MTLPRVASVMQVRLQVRAVFDRMQLPGLAEDDLTVSVVEVDNL